MTRKLKDGDVPWVSVGPSDILASLRKTGEGMRADTPFSGGQLLGRYTGEILGVQVGRKRSCDLAAGGMIVEVRLGKKTYSIDGNKPMQSDTTQDNVFGAVLIKNARWTPNMRAEMMNDPCGTAFDPNVKVTGSGRIWALRDIAVGEEMRWSYGKRYWVEHKQLLEVEPKKDC